MTNQHTKEIRPNDIMALYGLLWYLSLIPQLGIVLPSFESDFSAFQVTKVIYIYERNSMTYLQMLKRLEECIVTGEQSLRQGMEF